MAWDKMLRRGILATFVMTLLAFAMLGVSACHRLDPSQDATTIQGEWQVDGASMTFVITANQFKLPGGTSYDYTIDLDEKKVNFGVGNITGTASYRMDYNSEKQIILTLTEMLDGQETVTTFTKLSDNTAATPVITNATPEPTEGAVQEGDIAAGADESNNS